MLSHLVEGVVAANLPSPTQMFRRNPRSGCPGSYDGDLDLLGSSVWNARCVEGSSSGAVLTLSLSSGMTLDLTRSTP
jgi:hypothetical protein